MGKKRFSRYQFSLSANDGEAKSGSALGKYKDYITKVTKPVYTRSADSNPGGLIEVWVIPFLSASDTNLYRTTMSKRSSDQMNALIGANTLFNHKTPGVGDAKINTNRFSAAKLILGTSGTGSTKEPSKITGVPYIKETDAKSYSYPFGRGTGALSDENSLTGVFSALKTAAAAKDSSNENVYSLRPEIFR